jgi:UPF0716 protein FxsA
VLGKLLLLFTVVPLVELYLLLFIGDVVGFWPTVGIVLFTGVLGAWLAKREGLRVFRKWQEALAEYRMPEEGVLGGVLVLVGGVLLVTPGVLTDLVGFLLLVPPTRRLVAAVVRRRVERRIADGSIHVVTYTSAGTVGRRSAAPPGVIDVEGEVVEEEPPPPRRLADVET